MHPLLALSQHLLILLPGALQSHPVLPRSAVSSQSTSPLLGKVSPCPHSKDPKSLVETVTIVCNGKQLSEGMAASPASALSFQGLAQNRWKLLTHFKQESEMVLFRMITMPWCGGWNIRVQPEGTESGQGCCSRHQVGTARAWARWWWAEGQGELETFGSWNEETAERAWKGEERRGGR